MKTFQYKYRNRKNDIVTAKLQAMNLPQARAMLKERKIAPMSIKEDVNHSFMGQFFQSKKVNSEEIVVFSQLFAGAIRAGVSVKDSLSMLVKQIESPILQNRIADIIVDIDSGTALSASFGKHTDIFPRFYPLLLKAGELSGNLGDVLDYIGSYLDRIDNIKKEIRGIFTYPIIVLGLSVMLLTLILIFVAPTFKKVFSQAKIKLPVPTQVLFFLSDIIKNYYIIIILIGVGVFFLFRAIKKSPQGEKILDRLVFELPLFGGIIRQMYMLRLIRTLDILVNNSVPILQSLQLSEESLDNLFLKDIIIQMRQDVSRGMPIAGALFDYPQIIPPMIAYSISMGEKSGKLGETLTRLGGFIDKNLYFSMKKLSSRLDPIITLILGGIVLFIALSIYLPIFDMITTVTV